MKTEDRDDKGKFIDGNPGGPGRPRGAVSPLDVIRQILEKEPERLQAIAEAYVDEALTDAMNRRDFIDRFDGKPLQTVDANVNQAPPIGATTVMTMLEEMRENRK